MSRPYVALTPAQEAWMDVLDAHVDLIVGIVLAGARAGYDGMSEDDIAYFTRYDIAPRREPRWQAALDAAVERGELVLDGDNYALPDEVTP